MQWHTTFLMLLSVRTVIVVRMKTIKDQPHFICVVIPVTNYYNKKNTPSIVMLMMIKEGVDFFPFVGCQGVN